MSQQSRLWQTHIAYQEGWASAVDRGLRKPDQQDSVGQLVPDVEGYRSSRQGYLLVLADGVGGGVRGDIASKTAVDAIIREYSSRVAAATDLGGLLQRVIRLANGEVAASAGDNTTCVCLAIRDRQANIAWVGDSRAYWLHQDHLTQLTTDHSWANEVGPQLLADNLIKPEELNSSANRHKITRALGIQDTVEPDLVPPLTLAPGDRLLLCSDGLWDMVPDEVIEEQLRRSDIELRDIAAELAAQANRRGGRDNISLFVVDAGTVLKMLANLDEEDALGLEPTALSVFGGLRSEVREAQLAADGVANESSAADDTPEYELVDTFSPRTAAAPALATAVPSSTEFAPPAAEVPTTSSTHEPTLQTSLPRQSGPQMIEDGATHEYPLPLKPWRSAIDTAPPVEEDRAAAASASIAQEEPDPDKRTRRSFISSPLLIGLLVLVLAGLGVNTLIQSSGILGSGDATATVTLVAQDPSATLVAQVLPIETQVRHTATTTPARPTATATVARPTATATAVPPTLTPLPTFTAIPVVIPSATATATAAADTITPAPIDTATARPTPSDTPTNTPVPTPAGFTPLDAAAAKMFDRQTTSSNDVPTDWQRCIKAAGDACGPVAPVLVSGYIIYGDFARFWFYDIGSEQIYKNLGFVDRIRSVDGRVLGAPISQVVKYGAFLQQAGLEDWRDKLLSDYMQQMSAQNGWNSDDLGIQFFQNGVVACNHLVPTSLQGDCDLLNIGSLYVSRIPGLDCTGDQCAQIPTPFAGEFAAVLGARAGADDKLIYFERLAFENYLSGRPRLAKLGEMFKNKLLGGN